MYLPCSTDVDILIPSIERSIGLITKASIEWLDPVTSYGDPSSSVTILPDIEEINVSYITDGIGALPRETITDIPAVNPAVVLSVCLLSPRNIDPLNV